MPFRKNAFFKTTVVTVVCAFVAVLISMVVLFGWIFHIDILTRFGQGWSGMKVNTALAIFFSGTSLLLFATKKNNILAALLAGTVFLIGALSLSEYLFSWDAQIDELFFKDGTAPIHQFPGRMSPFTAVSFIMIGMSLFVYIFSKKIFQHISNISAAFAFYIAFISFSGYLFGAHLFYEIPGYVSIAFPTAVSIIVLSLAIFFDKPDLGFLSAFNKPTFAAHTGWRGALFVITMIYSISWLEIAGQNADLYDHGFGSVLMIIVFSISFFFIIWWRTKKLNQSEEEKGKLFKLLQEREMNLKLVMDNSPEFIWSMDREHRLITFNKTFAEEFNSLTGSLPVPGIIHYKALSPESAAVWKQKVDEVMAGNIVTFERSYEIAGKTKYGEAFFYPIKKDNTVIGATCFVMNITERKKAKEDLKESREKYKGLSEATFEAIFISEKGICIEQNLTAEKMFGYTAEEAIGRYGTDWIVETDREKVMQNMLAGYEEPYEAIALRKDGTTFPCILRGRMMHYKGKNVRVTSLSDITERKQTDKQIQLLAEMLDSIPASVSIHDFEGNFLWFNKKFIDEHGFSEEEIKSIGVKGIDVPTSRELYDERVKNLIEQGEIFIEVEHFRKNGSHFPLVVNAKLTKWEDKDAVLSVATNITERKLMERQLEEKSVLLNSIIESSALSVFSVDRDYRYIGYNSTHAARMKALYGVEIEIGQIMSKYQTVREDREKARINIDRALKGEQFTVAAYSGEPGLNRRYFEIDHNPIYDAKGEVIGVSIFANDITERKQAEMDIRELSEKLETTLNAIPDLLFEVGIDGKIFSYHSNRDDLLAVAPDLFLGRFFADVLPPDAEKQCLSAIQEAAEKGWSTGIQYSLQLPQGKCWFELSVAPIPESNDQERHFILLARDITERNKTEDKIREQERKYRALVNSAPDAIVISDEKGIIQIANLQAEKLFGYTRTELVGMPVEKLLPQSLKDKHKAYRQEFISEHYKGTMGIGRELTALRKDGFILPVEISLSPFKSAEGILVTASVRDITLRKKAEKELEESYKSVRKLTEHLQKIREEERTYIAREIHDELGQQLTVMMMDVALLDKKVEAKNSMAKEKIKELMGMLDEMVKSVRRISTELRPSILDDLGLEAAVQQHLKEFETRSGILTSLTVPPKNLEMTDPVKNALFRIFQESLTNVARHSGAKKVTIKLEKENGDLVLMIEDNGVGFDEKKASAKRTLGVLGMKERAVAIGGVYSISGKRGKGTTILVKVPLHR